MLTCPNRTGKRLGGISRRRFAIVSAFFILLLGAITGALTPEEEALQAEQTAARQKVDWQAIYPLIQSADLQRHVTYLESLGSRVAGYPGNAAAADYVARQFQEIGLKDVSRPLKSNLSSPPRPFREEFEIAVPVVRSASMQISGGAEKIRLYPFWPNLVRTSQLPKGGVELPLIYGGSGRLAELNRQEVAGRAVLLELDRGDSWMNPVRLGAKAIIFISPPATSQQNFRAAMENKFLSLPTDIPRFWIPREAAQPVLAQVQSQRNTSARLECDMVWEQRPSWNIVGEIPGADPKLRSEVIYLEAYYDSMSAVPELAPGADSAGGIAALLEIARIMKQHPPARTVRFLATGAHFVSLSGTRSYLAQHFEDLSQGQPYTRPAKFLGLIPYHKTYYKRQKIHLFCALDLSSQSDQVGVFYKGKFYNINDRAFKQQLAQVGQFFQDAALALAKQFPETNSNFSDAINEITNSIDQQGTVSSPATPWRSLIFGGEIASDAEPVTIAGSKGVGFITCNDFRPRVDTPFDRSEAMNFSNLLAQTRLLACLLHEAGADPKAPFQERLDFGRATLSGGFGRISGRSLIFDAKSGIVPNKSVPGSLVVMRAPEATLAGVRANVVELVDARGGYDIEGVANAVAYGDRAEWRMVYLESYHLDPATGSVDYAPDFGSSQGRSYPVSFYMIGGEVERPIIMFPCVSLTVFDLIDPQNLSSLYVMTVLDGEGDAELRSYSFIRPHSELNALEATAPRLENVGIVFAQKDARIKLLVSAGAGSIRMVLLNAASVNNEHPSGLGYRLDHSQAILNTALAAAQDMRALDAMRIAKFQRFRIINKNILELHERAKQYIDQAEQDLKNLDYSAMEANAFAGWGYESKAYPAVQATNDDVVKAVIFYLALMLPFAFFMERLMLAARAFSRQLLGFLGIFILTVAIFSRIHPAFRISANPLIVPLAFIMLSLSLLVTSIVAGKFEAQLRAMREQMGGVHRADIGRMGVASAAFNLGVSNMRKRKARTLFTCLTLVALTFTVLSFTSVTSSTRFTVRAEKGKPRYQGLLLRDPAWEKIEISAYQVLKDQFSDRPIAPRAWYVSSRSEETAGATLVTLSLNNSPARRQVSALVGMTPEEDRVTRFGQALTAGRWFQPGENYSCIVPDKVAETFHLSEADLGSAQINIGGMPFTVIGILNSPRATAIKDLDQEPLSPADFIQMASNRGGAAQAFRKFQHLSWDDVAIIPFSAALDFGAPVQSIAIGFPNSKQTEKVLLEMLPRLNFNLYAGQGNQIRKWSALSSTSLGGVPDLVFPIMIVALIILNTMLGSVYERVKEIHIYSSIGLAPNHIGVLFIAEAFVYAVLGAIFGYLIGQSFAMVIIRYSSGLELNYSSLSAVASTAIVIAVVLLSAVYPARKASQVATPAVDRHWQLPDPVGDVWEIRLPFAVTGAQATAMNAFLMEWFQAFEGHSIGDFVTENVQFCEEAGPHGKGYCIKMMTWLAPFDLGVSQRAELRTIAAAMEDVFEIKYTLYRESGDVTSWKRVNRTFLNNIRKQFLIWRALSAKDRDRYLGLSKAAEPREETAA